MHGKDNADAQLRQHAVVGLLAHEKARQPRRSDIGFDGFGVKAFARRSDGVGVNVGGKDLQPDRALRRLDLLAKQHRDGIGFFACAATRDPNAQGMFDGVGADKVGHDFLGEKVEHFGIAKEARDVDEQVLGEQLPLALLLAQQGEIACRVCGGEAGQRYAPLDAAPKRARLVQREVVAGFGAQETDDRRHLVGRRRRTLR